MSVPTLHSAADELADPAASADEPSLHVGGLKHPSTVTALS